MWCHRMNLRLKLIRKQWKYQRKMVGIYVCVKNVSKITSEKRQWTDNCLISSENRIRERNENKCVKNIGEKYKLKKNCLKNTFQWKEDEMGKLCWALGNLLMVSTFYTFWNFSISLGYLILSDIVSPISS